MEPKAETQFYARPMQRTPAVVFPTEQSEDGTIFGGVAGRRLHMHRVVHMQRQCEANEGGQRGYHLIKRRNPNSALEGVSREHTMTRSPSPHATTRTSPRTPLRFARVLVSMRVTDATACHGQCATRQAWCSHLRSRWRHRTRKSAWSL